MEATHFYIVLLNKLCDENKKNHIILNSDTINTVNIQLLKKYNIKTVQLSLDGRKS